MQNIKANMQNIKEVIKRAEVKIAFIFAVLALLTVFLIGLIKHIKLDVIVKRIIVVELFYIPMGLLIGYIYKSIYKTESPRTSENLSVSGKKNEVKIDTKINDDVIEKENEQNTSADNIDTIVDEVPEEITDISDISIPRNEEESREMGIKEEYKKVEKLSKSSMGKHIIVNDKKIINDPKLMAEAVRTMMNKEE